MDDQVSTHLEDTLLSDAVVSIEEARSNVAQSVNGKLVMLNWNIGKRIGEDILRERIDGELYERTHDVAE